MPPKQGGEASRVIERVIHLGEQDVLDEKLSTGNGEVLPGRFEYFRERMAEILWNQPGSGQIVGGVQRKREVHLGLDARQPEDPSGDPHGRHGDGAMAQTESLRSGENGDAFENGSEIE